MSSPPPLPPGSPPPPPAPVAASTIASPPDAASSTGSSLVARLLWLFPVVVLGVVLWLMWRSVPSRPNVDARFREGVLAVGVQNRSADAVRVFVADSPIRSANGAQEEDEDILPESIDRLVPRHLEVEYGAFGLRITIPDAQGGTRPLLRHTGTPRSVRVEDESEFLFQLQYEDVQHLTTFPTSVEYAIEAGNGRVLDSGRWEIPGTLVTSWTETRDAETSVATALANVEAALEKCDLVAAGAARNEGRASSERLPESTTLRSRFEIAASRVDDALDEEREVESFRSMLESRVQSLETPRPLPPLPTDPGDLVGSHLDEVRRRMTEEESALREITELRPPNVSSKCVSSEGLVDLRRRARETALGRLRTTSRRVDEIWSRLAQRSIERFDEAWRDQDFAAARTHAGEARRWSAEGLERRSAERRVEQATRALTSGLVAVAETESPVLAAGFDPRHDTKDGTERFVTVHEDGGIRLWTLDDDGLTSTSRDVGMPLAEAEVSRTTKGPWSTIVVGDEANRRAPQLWRLAESPPSQVPLEFGPMLNQITAMAFAESEPTLILGKVDGLFQRWTMAGRAVDQQALSLSNGAITAFLFDGRNKFGLAIGRLLILREDGNNTRTRVDAPIQRMVESRGRRALISFLYEGGDLEVSRIPPVKNVQPRSLRGIASMALTLDGAHLLAGGVDGRVWRVTPDDEGGLGETQWSMFSYPLTTLASRDGNLVVTGDDRGRVAVWRPEKVVPEATLAKLPAIERKPEGVAGSANGLDDWLVLDTSGERNGRLPEGWSGAAGLLEQEGYVHVVPSRLPGEVVTPEFDLPDEFEIDLVFQPPMSLAFVDDEDRVHPLVAVDRWGTELTRNDETEHRLERMLDVENTTARIVRRAERFIVVVGKTVVPVSLDVDLDRLRRVRLELGDDNGGNAAKLIRFAIRELNEAAQPLEPVDEDFADVRPPDLPASWQAYGPLEVAQVQGHSVLRPGGTKTVSVWTPPLPRTFRSRLGVLPGTSQRVTVVLEGWGNSPDVAFTLRRVYNGLQVETAGGLKSMHELDPRTPVELGLDFDGKRVVVTVAGGQASTIEHEAPFRRMRVQLERGTNDASALLSVRTSPTDGGR